MTAKRTQEERLLHYLHEHPGCSSLEIVRDLSIVNTTGRISDLRSKGYAIEAIREQGVYRYVLREAAQLALAL